MGGVENPMRRGRADQLVAEEAPRIVDAHDLRVLGEGIIDLAIARLDLFSDRLEREKAAARQGVHGGDEVGEAVLHDEIDAMALERLDRRGRLLASRAPGDEAPVLA